MPEFKLNDITLHYEALGKTCEDGAVPMCLWAHGWGQSQNSFHQMIGALESRYAHVAIDFPGFGKSSMPPLSWNTEDYADFIAEFIKTKIKRPVIWVGHSFGCRVGTQIAAKYPELIDGYVMIAGAGLPRQCGFFETLKIQLRIYTYKGLKRMVPLRLVCEDWLKLRFGSADYKAAGGMRPIFLRAIREDLSATAAKIKCPVLLVYGDKDTETPPEIGQRYASLIPNAEYVCLKNQDHYSLLSGGHHQVANLIVKFINKTSQA